MQDAFNRFAQPGALALDIGSHNGFHSLLLAAHGMNVVAFEPNPCIRKSIENQLDLNSDLDIKVLPYALSNVIEEVRLADRGRMSQIGKVGIPVRAVTLDSLNFQPSLIKIDVEGHEAAALEGALETLKRYQPIILADFDSHATITSLQNLLEPIGYKIDPGPPITAVNN